MLPASLEMLQRLSYTTRTGEAYKYLDGILYAYYCFLIVLIIIIQSSGKWEGREKEDLFILFPGCFLPRLKPS